MAASIVTDSNGRIKVGTGSDALQGKSSSVVLDDDGRVALSDGSQDVDVFSALGTTFAAVVVDNFGRSKVGMGNPYDGVVGIPGPPGVDNLTVGPNPPSNPTPFLSVWLDTN